MRKNGEKTDKNDENNRNSHKNDQKTKKISENKTVETEKIIKNNKNTKISAIPIKSPNFVKKCLNLLKTEESAAFKAHLLASIFPLLGEDERKRHFDSVFSGLGLEAQKTFLDFVFGESDRFLLPPSGELLAALGAKGVFGLDLKEGGKDLSGAKEGESLDAQEAKDGFGPRRVKKWADVFKGEIEFREERERENTDEGEEGDAESDVKIFYILGSVAFLRVCGCFRASFGFYCDFRPKTEILVFSAILEFLVHFWVVFVYFLVFWEFI